MQNPWADARPTTPPRRDSPAYATDGKSRDPARLDWIRFGSSRQKVVGLAYRESGEEPRELILEGWPESCSPSGGGEGAGRRRSGGQEEASTSTCGLRCVVCSELGWAELSLDMWCVVCSGLGWASTCGASCVMRWARLGWTSSCGGRFRHPPNEATIFSKSLI